MKYFGKILLGLALLSGIFLQAEEPYDMDWVNQFGEYGKLSTCSTIAYSITSDQGDNLFVTGSTTGPFLGETNSGYRDVFITKYKSDGMQEWVRQFGTAGTDEGYSVTIDEDDNLFVTGYAAGTFPGETSSGGRDIFIAKYRSDGTQEWVKQFGTSDNDYGKSIITDGNGNLFVTGYTSPSSGGSSDAFIAKFRSDGTQEWVKYFGASDYDYDHGDSVAIDEGDNLFVTGMTAGTFPGEVNSGGYRDAFIAKFRSDGTQEWIKQFGTSDNDYGESIITDGSGNLFVAGYTYGTFPGEVNSGGYSDAFIAKFRSDGTQEWIKQFGTAGPDMGYSIVTDQSDNLFVAGAGSHSVFIAKYKSDGTQKWFNQFGTSNWDIGYSITADGNSDLFVAGRTDGIFPGETSSGCYRDAFIAKFRSDEANTIPIADAGEDQSSVVGDIVPLDGSGSSDVDNDPLVFSWSLTKPKGSSAEILDPTSDLTSFTPDVPGTYTASLIVNDGFADSELDTTKIVVVSVSTAITEIINETIDAIDAMPDDSFRNPNRRKALINKLNATLKMVDDGEYKEALDKLQSDILPKIDGCTLRGKSDKQDWIINCENQEEVYNLITKAISRLETLI